jgi:hypothetical protein
LGGAGCLFDKFAVPWYLITDTVCTLYIIKYYMKDQCNLYSSPYTVRVIKSRRERWIGPCDAWGRREMFTGLLLGNLKERDPRQ